MTRRPGRVAELLRQLADRDADRSGSLQLCGLAVEVTQVNGASIMILSEELAHGSLCTSDGVSAYLDDLQFTLGQGPALDAHALGRPVLVDDLGATDEIRWPALTPLALDAGVAAVFAFPLRIGAVRLGAMTLLRDVPGPLEASQFDDAEAMAMVATRTVLALQAHAPPGSVAEELEEGSNFHFVVHQAAGMVSVQLGVSVTEALVRLRARAFQEGRSIGELSRAVVERRVHFREQE